MAKKRTYEELEKRVKELEKETVEREQVEEALRGSEEKYRTLFKNANEAIYVGQDERIVFANPKTEEIYGYSAEELASKPFINFIHDKDQKMVLDRHKRRLRGEKLPTIYPFRIVNKAGDTKWVELKVAPFSWDNRPAALCFQTDITERKLTEEALQKAHDELERRVEERTAELARTNEQLKLELNERKRAEDALAEERNLLRTVIDNLPDYIYVKDTESRYVVSNNPHVRFLGATTPDEVIGKTVFELFPQELASKYHADDQEVIRSGLPILTREERSINPKGEMIWNQTTKVPLRDSSGKIMGLVGIARDITERKKAEEALQESEEKYKTLTNNLNVGVYRVTPGAKGRFLEANPAYIRIYGYESREELLKSDVRDLYQDPADRKKFSEKMQRDGFVRNEELRLKRKDGTPFIGSVSAVAVKDENGQVKYFDCFQEDVTKRIQAEEELRESEEKYRTILESIEEGYYEVDLAGNLTFFNDSLCRITGSTKDELIGMNNREYMDQQIAKKVYQTFNKVYTTGKPTKGFGYEIKLKDGTRRNVESSVSLIKDAEGHRIGFRGIVQDVTERVRTEETLRRQNEYLAALNETTAGLISRLELNELLEAIVARAGALIGTQNGFIYLYDPEKGDLEARVGLGTYKKYIGFRIKPGKGLSGKVWETGQPLVVEDYSVWPDRLLDARFDDVKAVVGIPLKSGSSVAGVIGLDHCERFGEQEIAVLSRFAELASVALDNAQLYRNLQQELAERKQAEQALRESEEKYRTILESIEESYYEVDLTGNLTFFNDSTCKILGYSKDELIGMNNRQFMHQENAEKVYETFNRVYTTGEPAKGSDWDIMRKDGTRRYVEASVSLIKDAEGQPTGFRGIGRDITERKRAREEKKRLEAQFQAAQRMEAMGTLAGGIAHDFNNLLMAIQGNASLMLSDKPPEHPDYERLKNIEQGVRSGAELTRQLLSFAMGGKYEVKPTDMNELMKRTSGMFGRTKKEITIHRKYQKAIWPVEADQGQIEQVVLNLYVNAWQAMPAGGELYLETENVTLDENYVKPYDLEPGRYVKISLTDTGVGMDEATQQRIFEPFFTTKEMGRGTGLGLASVYGIIKNHDGIITVDSTKGEETTFTMYLPAGGPERIAQRAESSEALEIVRGSETVLLVDDEEMVLEVGEEMLKELGYTVLTARGGKEAIEIVSKGQRAEGRAKGGKERYARPQRSRLRGGRAPGARPSAPDIVILDMIMPGMGGGEAYDELKRINPTIKVLLSSGYSIDGQATEILERGCNGFIQKPFTMRDLSWRTREILDIG